MDAGFSARLFDFEEFADSGTRIVREHGALPGVVGRLGGQRGRFRMEGRAAYHAGGVTYDGQTQGGRPLTSRTDERILDLGVRAGYRPLGAPFELMPYVAIGYLLWERDIRGTGNVRGLQERYGWSSLAAGADATLYRKGRVSVGLDARVLRTQGPESRVTFGQPYDAVTLALGNEWGGRLGIPVRMPLKNGLSLSIAPWAEAWSLGRSPNQTLTSGGVPVGTVFQPRSESWSLGIDITIGKTR